MEIRFIDEGREWTIECPQVELTEREEMLLAVLHDPSSYLSPRFLSRLGNRLHRFLLDNLEGAAVDPSPRQIHFAEQIAKTLFVPIPEDALRYRDCMSDFIRRHVDDFNTVRAQRGCAS